MGKNIQWRLVSVMIFLNASLWFSVNACAQVVREEKPKGAGSASKTKSEDIEYYAKWRLRYISPGKVMVKWKGVEHKITDLDPAVKEYLWEHSDPQARQQLYDCYYYATAIGKDWGKELGYRMDTYYGAATEWAKAKKQWRERQKVWAVPDEAIKFIGDADIFLKTHKKELTKDQIEEIERNKEDIKSLGLLIGAIEVKKKEIAVKGISAGLIGIITDYCLGFTRPGFKATSELVGMIVGDVIAVLKEAQNKDPSAGEQIALLNEQIAKIKRTLNNHIETYKSRWQEFLQAEQEESSAVAALREATKEMINMRKKLYEARYAFRAADYRYERHRKSCPLAAEGEPCPTCEQLEAEYLEKNKLWMARNDEFSRFYNDYYSPLEAKFCNSEHPELDKREITSWDAWDKYSRDYNDEQDKRYTKRSELDKKALDTFYLLFDNNLTKQGDTPENKELLEKINELHEQRDILEMEGSIKQAENAATYKRFLASQK